MREARLELLFADLLMPGMAFGAVAAAAHEGRGDPVAHVPVRHLLTDGCNGAGEFMSGDVGQRDVRVMAHPAVPVAATDARRLDLHHDTMRGRRGVLDRDHLGGFREGFEQDGVHGVFLIERTVALAQRMVPAGVRRVLEQASS